MVEQDFTAKQRHPARCSADQFVLSTYEKQAVQRSDNIRNSLGLNFKSVALASRATGGRSRSGTNEKPGKPG
jgi:hypothetical protein